MSRPQDGYFHINRAFYPTDSLSLFYKKPRTFTVYLTLCRWANDEDDEYRIGLMEPLKKGEFRCSRDELVNELLLCFGLKITKDNIKEDLKFLMKFGLIKKISNANGRTRAIYSIVHRYDSEDKNGY